MKDVPQQASAILPHHFKQHLSAINIIKKNQSFFESLITHRFPLENINNAFDLASSGKGIKIIIKP